MVVSIIIGLNVEREWSGRLAGQKMSVQLRDTFTTPTHHRAYIHDCKTESIGVGAAVRFVSTGTRVLLPFCLCTAVFSTEHKLNLGLCASPHFTWFDSAPNPKKHLP